MICPRYPARRPLPSGKPPARLPSCPVRTCGSPDGCGLPRCAALRGRLAPLGLFDLAKGCATNTKQIQCIIVRVIVLEKLDIGVMRWSSPENWSSTICRSASGSGCELTIWFIETSSDFGIWSRPLFATHAIHAPAIAGAAAVKLRTGTFSSQEADCEKCPLCTRRDRLWRRRRVSETLDRCAQDLGAGVSLSVVVARHHNSITEAGIRETLGLTPK